MGYACGQSLPALSPSHRISDCGEVFPHNESMELAAASVAKAYRRRSTPNESLEPEGKSGLRSYK